MTDRTLISRRVRSERGPVFVAGPRRVAVAYPSPYRVGMSSLGYQRVITLMRRAGIAAERCFLPDDEATRGTGPALTYESSTSLGSFPLIAVSFAYEAELIGLLQLLQGAGIPARREDRTAQHPRILLGGPIGMASPAFLADFVDAVLLGEAEDTVGPAVTAFFDSETNEGWLDAIAALPGGWVPERDGMRFPAISKASDEHLPARSAWLAPEAELSDMFLIEGERGCHRMCTFCVMRRTTNGGMRLVGPDRVLALIPEEARKVGLVGAAISDHPRLVDLLSVLVDNGRQVSVSSLRADRIAKRPDIARLLRKSGARTLTTASDGASERVRKWMSKGTKEEHLLESARQASSLGYSTLKLYQMVGVPGEEDADIDELIRFTLEVAQVAKGVRVALGVAPFVAKRQTPMDGADFAGIKLVDKRLKRLKRGLKGRAVVRPVSARWAWLEHELSQGGPASGAAIAAGLAAGGRFADYRRALEAVDSATRRPWVLTEGDPSRAATPESPARTRSPAPLPRPGPASSK